MQVMPDEEMKMCLQMLEVLSIPQDAEEITKPNFQHTEIVYAHIALVLTCLESKNMCFCL